VAVCANELPTTWPPDHQPGQIAVGEIAEQVATTVWKRVNCGTRAQWSRVDD
jgi:hypothetical protein